jgi:hypothetical protein
MIIHCKDSVRFSVLRPEIWSIFGDVYDCCHNYGQVCEISSACDGHGPQDPHYNGFALDISCRNIIKQIAIQIVECLQQKLGLNYFVQFEDDVFKDGKQVRWKHIHIQIQKSIWPLLM